MVSVVDKVEMLGLSIFPNFIPPTFFMLLIELILFAYEEVILSRKSMVKERRENKFLNSSVTKELCLFNFNENFISCTMYRLLVAK